jgi:hypothetical protein
MVFIATISVSISRLENAKGEREAVKKKKDNWKALSLNTQTQHGNRSTKTR